MWQGTQRPPIATEGGKEHKAPLLFQKVARNIKNPVDKRRRGGGGGGGGGGVVFGCKGFHSNLRSHKTWRVTQEYPSQRKHFRLRSNLADFAPCLMNTTNPLHAPHPCSNHRSLTPSNASPNHPAVRPALPIGTKEFLLLQTIYIEISPSLKGFPKHLHQMQHQKTSKFPGNINFGTPLD